jgi:hypothetical protein
MELRFFADHCVPNTVVESLRNAGHEVWRVRDCIPTESPVWSSFQRRKNWMRFLYLLTVTSLISSLTLQPLNKGIISLQVRNHPEILPEIMSRLKDYLVAHPDMAHYVEKLLLVEAHRI